RRRRQKSRPEALTRRFAMRLENRIARLERILPPPPPPRPEELLWGKRWGEILDRLIELIEQAFPLMTENQQEQVVGALEQAGDLFEGPFGAWHLHLSRGWCRLPQLSPDAGKTLLLTWLSPDVDGSSVCRECGLEYPRHRHPPLNEWRVL